MKVLVCGGRDYSNVDRLFGILDDLAFELNITALRHGGCRGADSLAAEWAESRSVPTEVFPADWEAYGRRAGFIRNALMLKDGTVDLVVAFPGAAGTKMMLSMAENKNVRCVNVDRWYDRYVWKR